MNPVELEIPAELVELAGHEPAVAAGHHRPQLVDQRRLAHPRRPADQHDPALADTRGLERRLQRRHLAVAAYQPRRRQQPQRDVPLADPQRARFGARTAVAQPLQVVDHALRSLVAVVRLFLEQVHDDRGERFGHGRVDLRRWHRHPCQVVVGEPQGVAEAERRRTGGQLVQRRPQGVEVGALIHRPAGAPGLLRCQVRQRPQDLVVVGELGSCLRQRRRQREVDQGRVAVDGDHDVGRGDVAVHHPAVVRPGHRPGQLHRQLEELVDRKRLCPVGEGGLAGVSHDDRSGVLRRVQELRGSPDTAQPLQHRPLVLEPLPGVRAEWLLAHDLRVADGQPRHLGAGGDVHQLGTLRRVRRPAARHTTPPRRRPVRPITAYTRSRCGPRFRGRHRVWPRRPVFTGGPLR